MERRGKKEVLLIIGASVIVFAIILLGVGVLNNQTVFSIFTKVFIILVGLIFFSIASIMHSKDIRDNKKGLSKFFIGIVIAFWSTIGLAVTLFILAFVIIMSVWQV